MLVKFLIRTMIVALLVLLPGRCVSNAQGEQGKCATVPAGDWSVKFQRFKGPGSEATPYQIVSIKTETCDGYLYFSDLQLDVPRDRLFFIIEFSAFVYRPEDATKPVAQGEAFRIGGGDGEFDPAGYWRTPANKRWGTALAVGGKGLLQPQVVDERLSGTYIISVGITFISFGKDVWHLNPADGLKDLNKRLFDAAGNDDTAAIKTLIASGADVRATGVWGETPLIRAAHSGHTKSVALLLLYGSDVNAQTSEGFTAIRLASQYGHAETVQALLKAHANFQIKDKYGEDALLASCFEGRTRVWELLKAAGAEIGSPAEEFICAAGLGDMSKLQKMISDGINVNWTGPKQTSALQLAALNNRLDVINLLLSHNAEIDQTDQWGVTALRWALFRGDREIIKELISKGANVNLKDSLGATPLIVAAETRDLEGAKILLESGADADLTDNTGKTALDYAIEKANNGPVTEDDPMVALLKAHGRPRKP